jgi:DNA repair protein RadD
VKHEQRPHQLTGKAMLRSSVATGHKRPLVCMPTGAGKTVFAAEIFQSHFEKVPDGKVVFIVDSISLIDQTAKAFYDQGLYGIGVIQADHPMSDWSKPIQIASVQTLRNRGMPKGITLAIVDEAHDQYEWLIEIMASAEWADVPFIGLSATPWSKGLGNVYDDLLIPVRMQELIDEGLLSPFRVCAAAHPDLSSVKVARTKFGADYAEDQLSGVMQDGALIADIIDSWRKWADDRPTIAFCVDRAHAKKIQLRFEEAGIGCGYIDAYTERTERNRIRQQLDAGEIKVVANVGCLIKGVDWAIGCIILARPTRSEIRFVQMVGRGLRVNEGIPDCIILDHSDTTLRLGFVTDIHHTQLCTAKKGERSQIEPKASKPKECPKCHFLKPAKTHECPACGFKPEKRSEIEEQDGELVEITRAKLKESRDERERWFAALTSIALERGRSGGWVSHTFKKRFGIWPNGLSENSGEKPTPEIRRWVQHCDIAFAKRRKAA